MSSTRKVKPGVSDSDGAMSEEWIAVVITFKRDSLAKAAVASLLDQAIPFDHVLLVDNGASSDLAAWSGSHPNVSYIALPENVGPAGGMNASFRWAAEHVTDPSRTWIVRVDDDRTATSEFLADRRALARHALEADPMTAGVGGNFKRISRFTGVIQPIKRSEMDVDQLVRVDYLGTNAGPAFRLAPALEIGGFVEPLFIGFTEVNFALRLGAAGYRLYAPGWRMGLASPYESVVTPTERFLSHATPERKYYSLRNEIWTYRQLGRQLTAAVVAVTRPAGSLWRQVRREPREVPANLANSFHAVWDAYRDRLGARRELSGVDELGQRRPT